MHPELPIIIGTYDYDDDRSGDDLDYCAEAHYYEDGDRGIAIVRINEDDGYRLSSQRWGDAAPGIIMSDVPLGTHDTLHEAITTAERELVSIRGLFSRVRIELSHSQRSG